MGRWSFLDEKKRRKSMLFSRKVVPLHRFLDYCALLTLISVRGERALERNAAYILYKV